LIVSNIGQLTLTRKAGESIWIEDVEVVIGKTLCGKTKVVIRADKNVRVDRGEIRIKREAAAAAKGGEA
jgi:sRNA-binding carbon storage regulator CsrA